MLVPLTGVTIGDWRWRLLITHKGHPLRRTSQTVGRCLSVILREMHICFPFWGTPSMLGVRDAHLYIKRHSPASLGLLERDIDNAYWELDKGKILWAMKYVADEVRKFRRMRGQFYFSKAKAGIKSLDRIGKASDQSFRSVTLAEVTDFVSWGIHENNSFQVWGIVMRQQEKGVPIGGFLSAQLMCIWALATKHHFIESPDKLKLLKPLLQRWPKHLPPLHIKPRPLTTFPHAAFVPHNRRFFENQGMQGLFSPEERLLFTLTLGEVQVLVFAMGLWDSHPEGRVGKIIDRSVCTQRKFLLQYFLNFRPIHCMIQETTVHNPETIDPSVLLTRYMDNNYIAVLNIPPGTVDALRTFFCLFHSTLYDIPMKWEPDGSAVTWCEGCLTTQGDLLLKGVPAHSNPHCPAVCPMWTRWPDRWSPGCRVVLQSFIPALVLKSITLCSSAVTRDRDLQTVIQAYGYKGYPWKWW